ncbi:MAG TPA: hypothetical protein VMT53_21520 [Terriglobales bacterium]|nr:hypothetical protein [Terriglobales bacterium]
MTNLRRIAATIALFSMVCFSAVAQDSTVPASAQDSKQFDNRMFAELDKLVHAHRIKVGDTVTAHLTVPVKLRDGAELPKGTRLIGTVTEVKEKADKEGPSKLGLLFSKAAPKSGPEIPLQMALVAVAPHNQQNSVDNLTAGNPFSGSDRLQAGNASAELNQKSTEGEALSRGLGARAPAARANVNETAMEPGKSYLPNVALVSYSMGAPGTILASTSGSVYVDSGIKMMFLQQ